MALDTLVRGAFKTANRLTASLQTTVQHERWKAVDGYGKPSFLPAVERTALVMQKTKRFSGAGGEDIVANTQIVFLEPLVDSPVRATVPGRFRPTDPRDRLTMADDRVVTIVSVEGLEDPSTTKPYAETVWVV